MVMVMKTLIGIGNGRKMTAIASTSYRGRKILTLVPAATVRVRVGTRTGGRKKTLMVMEAVRKGGGGAAAVENMANGGEGRVQGHGHVIYHVHVRGHHHALVIDREIVQVDITVMVGGMMVPGVRMMAVGGHIHANHHLRGGAPADVMGVL